MATAATAGRPSWCGTGAACMALATDSGAPPPVAVAAVAPHPLAGALAAGVGRVLKPLSWACSTEGDTGEGASPADGVPAADTADTADTASGTAPSLPAARCGTGDVKEEVATPPMDGVVGDT